MNQNTFESEKEKYIHGDYHEKLLLERYMYFQNLQSAIERGNLEEAYMNYQKGSESIHEINQLYTPKEENLRVIHNQLVSFNTLCWICAFKSKPNPIHLHTISRHFDVLIEKVTTQQEAEKLIFNMLEAYCSLSALRTEKQYSQIVQKAIWHLTGNPSQKLNLNQLSETLGMSPSSLSRKFHAETGQTISQYHTAFRIRTAQRYLLEGDHTITQAALQTGFSDASYFSKVFAKFSGITPTEYIKKYALL